MTHQLDTDDYFIHCVQKLCAAERLNFFLIEPAWVEQFHAYLEQGKVWPRVLLNMHSEHHQPDDIYHRLVKLAAERGTQVIDPPDRALAAFDKSRLHPRLVEVGVPVPWTLIVPHDQAQDWRMTEEQRQELGSPFIIKPAMGYGRKGLVMDATSEADLQRSIAAWPDDNYLLQRRVNPRRVNGEPLYFRTFHVLDAVYLTWWNCFTDQYRLVAPQEQEEFDLGQVEEVVERVAALTGMGFFSSEIAQDETGQLVVIDYVNDQCHLLSQTASPQLGVPDSLVGNIAAKLVEGVTGLLGRAPLTGSGQGHSTGPGHARSAGSEQAPSTGSGHAP
jgi:hypothetical protein